MREYIGRYVSGARNWQLQASLKVAKCGDLCTEKYSIFGNFKVLPSLANSITRCLMNAQHSISDSLMMLPKLATCNSCNMGMRNLLICMPSALGPAALGLQAYISSKSRTPMLQVLCITSGTLKSAETYSWLLCLFI